MKSHISIIKTLDECNKILDSIASSMSEAFRICDLEMAPYYETATEFCDIDGGTGVAGTGGAADGAATDPSSKPHYKCTLHLLSCNLASDSNRYK